MAVEDIDYGRAAAVQGDSDTPVTVADLAEAAGVELVTGEDDDKSTPEPTRPQGPRRRRAAQQGPEDETA